MGIPPRAPKASRCCADGGTYIEMGQFTDAGSIETNWHRFCVKDINILGSWAFTADDIALGIAMLDRARDRYPFGDMQTKYPLQRRRYRRGDQRCQRHEVRQGDNRPGREHRVCWRVIPWPVKS